MFTRARRWTLSWARWIQSTSSHPVSLKYIFLLSYSFVCVFISPIRRSTTCHGDVRIQARSIMFCLAAFVPIQMWVVWDVWTSKI
jgi:hypothetical protein